MRAGDKGSDSQLHFYGNGSGGALRRGTPVFAEISPDMTVSVEDLRRVLKADTSIRAIIPVHTYGLPAAVDAIQKLVDEFKTQHGRSLMVIYDSAHAFGAAVDKKRVGQFGNAEVFSLRRRKRWWRSRGD